MSGPRSIRHLSALLILGAALAVLPPSARGQWVVAPGFGFGPGFGSPFWGGSYGFGPTYAGFGYGFGPGFGFPGYGNAFGIYPGAFSVLNQPDIQSGLAYNALATGRAAPYSFPVGPLGFGSGPGFGYGAGPYGLAVGPYGYAGAAYYNPYFASGLTPLAVQSAMDELALSRAGSPIRFRVVTTPAPADPAPAVGPAGGPVD